jgi:hypothetical protein
LKNSKEIYQYRNILMAAVASSVLIGFVMAPIDLITVNVAQNRIYGAPVLRNVSTKAVMQDLLKKKGLWIILTMGTLTSMTRYCFILTSFHCFDNYCKA